MRNLGSKNRNFPPHFMWNYTIIKCRLIIGGDQVVIYDVRGKTKCLKVIYSSNCNRQDVMDRKCQSSWLSYRFAYNKTPRKGGGNICFQCQGFAWVLNTLTIIQLSKLTLSYHLARQGRKRAREWLHDKTGSSIRTTGIEMYDWECLATSHVFRPWP